MLEKILSAVREIAKDATGELGFGFWILTPEKAAA